MKNVLTVGVAIVLLFPSFVAAQTLQEQHDSILRQLIAALILKVEILQEQLQELQEENQGSDSEDAEEEFDYEGAIEELERQITENKEERQKLSDEYRKERFCVERYNSYNKKKCSDYREKYQVLLRELEILENKKKVLEDSHSKKETEQEFSAYAS